MFIKLKVNNNLRYFRFTKTILNSVTMTYVSTIYAGHPQCAIKLT